MTSNAVQRPQPEGRDFYHGLLGNPSQFLYDSLGRLTRDTDAAGGFQDLARSELESGFEVAKTTALNRTTGHRVERLTTGEQRRLTTFSEGTQTETIIGNDQSRALTFADGTTINTTPGPDPRFGMQTPITASETTTTPAGLISNINRERSVSLSDPADPLSLTSLTDTATVNGRIFTNVFDRTNLEFTLTSPEGRQTTTRIDNQGRVVEVSAGNLLLMRLEYDPLGRLTRAAQGVAGNERAISFSYDADGFLAFITDAEGRTVSLSYDLAGRFTSQTLPDGRVIAYSYDANGNVTSITPPGQPQHIFAYTPVDLEGAYTPPDVGAGTNATHFFYNADRQLTQISRPDGQAIVFDYDTAGRRSLITLPRGSVQFNYDVNSGNQTTGTAPDGGILSFAYDGGLLTQESWTGEVSGGVTRAYDNDFRLTSLSVNGTGTVDLQYDNDNFLVTAGDLTLSRDAQNGLLIGSTLGGVSDSQTQNSFGEPTDYAASFSGAEVYSVQFTRDRLGRIVEKIETVEGVPTTFNYAYDLAGRLAEAKENGLVVATYTYDSNGNRLSLATPSGTITGSYDDQDRLTQYGSMSYTYTANEW